MKYYPYKMTRKIGEDLKSQIKLRELEAWQKMEQWEKLPFITISREYGCHANTIAEGLQNKLNEICDQNFSWAVFDRVLVEKIANEHAISEELIESLTRKNRSELKQITDNFFFDRPYEDTIFRLIAEAIIALAQKGHAIIIGRASYIIAREIKRGFHLGLFAPYNFRLKIFKETRNISSLDEAESLLKRMDKEREVFVKRFTKRSASDLYNLDMTINVEKNTIEEIIDIIVNALKVKKLI